MYFPSNFDVTICNGYRIKVIPRGISPIGPSYFI